MLPSTFMNLPREERAFIIACIDIKAKNDKEKQKELDRKAKR